MRRIVILAVAIALMLPGAALAQGSSTCQAYNPQLCSSVSQTSSSSGSEGTLPFTGLDAALLAVGGGTLLGAGLFVRRFARRLT